MLKVIVSTRTVLARAVVSPKITFHIGYFCPTPTIVKSAQELVILFLQHLAPVLRIAVLRRLRVAIYHGRSGTQFDGPERIDVLPGYRKNAAEKVARLPTLLTHLSSPPQSCQDKV